MFHFLGWVFGALHCDFPLYLSLDHLSVARRVLLFALLRDQSAVALVVALPLLWPLGRSVLSATTVLTSIPPFSDPYDTRLVLGFRTLLSPKIREVFLSRVCVCVT